MKSFARLSKELEATKLPMFADILGDVLPVREVQEFALHLFPVHLQPGELPSAAAERLTDGLDAATLGSNCDDVSGPDLIGRSAARRPPRPADWE